MTQQDRALWLPSALALLLLWVPGEGLPGEGQWEGGRKGGRQARRGRAAGAVTESTLSLDSILNSEWDVL